MKKILGLDLGTNSIGWAVVNKEEGENGEGRLTGIDSAGVRIIPMDAAKLGEFDKGNKVSQTADRTRFRSARRLRERFLLRRERLLRVLKHIGYLPEHFAAQIDAYGKFAPGAEPKLAWRKNETGAMEFLFQDSFGEMLSDFRERNVLSGEERVPYDWTLYYLRKKALSAAVSPCELAWILLNANQKRGYNQLREDAGEERPDRLEEIYSLKVLSVKEGEPAKGGAKWYEMELENGFVYRRTSRQPLDWAGKTKDFIVTTEIDEAGNPKTGKDGKVKRSLRAPGEDDWTLVKKKTEHRLQASGKTAGEFIYDSILADRNVKVRGKLIGTIERDYYVEETARILSRQSEFHPELTDGALYRECLELLYPNNESHRASISDKNIAYLLSSDILFYQRPLKSKKSLISDCPYEKRYYVENGKRETVALKCIPKSNPLYQEFRLWQFVQSLRLYRREGLVDGRLYPDADVTGEFLPGEAQYVDLFLWLSGRKDIDQHSLLQYLLENRYRDAAGKNLKKRVREEEPLYRWNYVEDKVYPCNETGAMIASAIAKAGEDPQEVLAGIGRTAVGPESNAYRTRQAAEMQIWHILYSVRGKKEIEKAMGTFCRKYGLPEGVAANLAKCPPFASEYGAYSEKAIKRLLPLMRTGDLWQASEIDAATRTRIDRILTGEADDTVEVRVREKLSEYREPGQFRGMPVWLSCYVVYNRHSESADASKWEKPEDIDAFLATFRQHSLRNPIVEQIVLETLRTVRDIWKQCGRIDEIHLELGREMKNPQEKRAEMTRRLLENEHTNLRIKKLLLEFADPSYGIEGVRPYSPTQQEILKIYEEGVLKRSGVEMEGDIADILRKFNESDERKMPTRSEILKYRLWLDQKYRSPYTGRFISLSKLFTPMYEIEHIIPRSRYFDDSMSNKVICEAEVNKLKDNELAHKFIALHHGQVVPLSGGGTVEILSLEAYEQLVSEDFSANRSKLKKLMLDDIPDSFIESQLNDSRYISKYVKGLLSNIVREKVSDSEYEREAVSRNLISCSGGVTDYLKKDWGVNDVWNGIILPRFVRLNEITGRTDFTAPSREGHLLPNVPLALQKGFQKKRIDHRHHAMDAIVIACATREHVNLLNNEAAKSAHKANRYQLSRKLRRTEKIMAGGQEKTVFKEFYKPWPSFTTDVRAALEGIVVSFKQNLRIINRASNRYETYVADAEGGKPVKTLVRQSKGDSWAVRKAMHKDTVFGKVNLRMDKPVKLSTAVKDWRTIVDRSIRSVVRSMTAEGKTAKEIVLYLTGHADRYPALTGGSVRVYYFTEDTGSHYYATRKRIDPEFNEKKIEQVTDSGIRQILETHLAECGNDPETAFSADGLERMNADIRRLNGGRPHCPVYSVRVFEKADKFAVGTTGNKAMKYVEAAKGTNLFFAVYLDSAGKRIYETIPLNAAVERMKAGLPVAAERDGCSLLFVLSPNDLVYLPTAAELEAGRVTVPLDRSRIYKAVSFTGVSLYFVPYAVSKLIYDKCEFYSLNKMERALTGEMIKETCLPIKVDRLGNIISVSGSAV